MRPVLVCPDDLLFRLLRGADLPGEPPLYVVEDAAVRGRIARRGADAIAGDLEDAATYRRAFRGGGETALVWAPPERLERVVSAIRAAASAAGILAVVEDGADGGSVAGVTTLPMSAIADRVLQPELERAALRMRVDRLRDHFSGADRVLILMQDDPDPDAIASALALRVLLGRNKATAVLATFGRVTRPENVAMLKILDIDVDEVTARAVRDFDRVAMVDVQPTFLEQGPAEVDLVIDHHPEDRPVRARLKDVRPGYGATSTIMTEYLRAADVKITQRLATALLYGIKSDTLHLERGGTRADMEAFAYLHVLANHNALRRIERPELPQEALDVLAHGIADRQLIHGVLFSHLGSVGSGDLVPQFADLFLQVEGAEWSVVSAIVGSEIHISVRNVGYVKGAGDVVRNAFADLGGAGGHRAMAKAVIRVRDWRARVGDTSPETVRRTVTERFLRALRTKDA